MPAGTTTYFKIGQPPSLTGLGVSVGAVLGLSDVITIKGYGYTGAGNYVLGSNYDEETGTLTGTVNGTETQLLVDKDNTWYAGITPDAAYNAVRLNMGFASAINLANLSRNMSIQVYNAFHYSTPPAPDCGTPTFSTPGEVQGVSLNLAATTQLLALDSAILNPHYAIDNSTATYSRITSGTLGIASAISQTILFQDNGTTGDMLKVTLSLPLSALSASVLASLKVQVYNNHTPIAAAQPVSALISADILGLLGDNTAFDVYLKPGVSFNRAKISLEGLASISPSILGGGVRIYDVRRVTNAPIITSQPTDDSVCIGQDATLTASATGDALNYTWQTYEDSLWISAGTGSTLTIPNTTPAMDGKKYRVQVTGGYCASAQATVISDEAVLIVSPLPSTPAVHIGP